MTKNGNWLKIASLTAVGGLIITVITILSFAGGAIDEKIDGKILAHGAETAVVQYKMQQDIAVIQIQQKQIQKDIGEIKKMIRESQ